MMIPAGCIRISPAPCPDAGGSSSGLRSPGDFASRHPGLRGTDDWRVVPGAPSGSTGFRETWKQWKQCYTTLHRSPVGYAGYVFSIVFPRYS